MDESTLDALNGSIEKWQKIVDGTGIDASTGNCPLCKEFFLDNCRGCPVYEKTKATICRDTPYQQWSEAGGSIFLKDNQTGYIHTPASLAAAKSELDFLKSLLPATTP